MKAFLQEYGTSLLCIIMVVMMIAISTPVGSSVSTALKGTVGDFSRMVNGDKSGNDGLMGKADSSMKEALSGGEDDNKPTLTTGTLMNGKTFNEHYISFGVNNIKDITFTDEKAPNDVETEDLTVEQDGSIIAWLDGTTYKVSSQESGVEIKANEDCSYMFYFKFDLQNTVYIKSVDITNLNTSYTTDMNNMFGGGPGNSIKIYGLTSLDTHNVINMKCMFEFSNGNDTLDLSSFDTSKVTNMSGMFRVVDYNTDNLKTIYVSNKWNISNVTDSSTMFINRTSLIGQSGTTYDSSKTDASMANWETGYLTLKTN